jgi:hypothetical protein
MPSTQKQWTVAETNGFDGLKLATDAAVPKVGEKDVLVKCKYMNICQCLTPLRRPPANKDRQSTPHLSTTATSPSSKASTHSPSAKA